jgi:hypothetical protein
VAFGLRRLDRVKRGPTDRFTRGLVGTPPERSWERSDGKRTRSGRPVQA